MNKYITNVVVCSIICVGSFGFAKANTADLERNVKHAINRQLAEVNITLNWSHNVKMKDVMSRPPRGSARNSNIVLKKETKQTRCKGTLTQTGQVVMPTVCINHGNWELENFALLFANGKKGVGTTKSIYIKKDVAYIKVAPELTKGLTGIPVLTTPKGKSLKEHFGRGILDTLSSFFHSKGVEISRRYLRPGKVYRDFTLQVGDAVLYKGQLIALVKKDVKHLYEISEQPLAVLR